VSPIEQEGLAILRAARTPPDTPPRSSRRDGHRTAIPKGTRTHTLRHFAVCRTSLPSDDPPLVRHMGRTHWVPRPPKGHGEENGESGKNAPHGSERGEGEDLFAWSLGLPGIRYPQYTGWTSQRGHMRRLPSHKAVTGCMWNRQRYLIKKAKRTDHSPPFPYPIIDGEVAGYWANYSNNHRPSCEEGSTAFSLKNISAKEAHSNKVTSETRFGVQRTPKSGHLISARALSTKSFLSFSRKRKTSKQ